MDIYDLQDWLEKFGEWLGLFMVFAPVVYDVLGLGIRGFYDWRIGYWGIVCMIAGGLILLASKIIRWWWSR